MKRQARGGRTPRTGDIRKDYSEKQLAKIGAVALAYNEAEIQIDALIHLAFNLTGPDALELLSRINGVDGKIEIAKSALSELGATPEIQTLVSNSLGKNGFQLLKQYRDAVIHARDLDTVSGIATTAVKRGVLYEVLLSDAALNGLYDRLVIIKDELVEATIIATRLVTIKSMNRLKRQLTDLLSHTHELPDRTKAKSEQAIQAVLSRYREHQTRRLSLPPLPEFPTESELRQAHLQWLTSQQRGQSLLISQRQQPPHPQPMMHPGVQDPLPTSVREKKPDNR
jgi:hypothetical protein